MNPYPLLAAAAASLLIGCQREQDTNPPEPRATAAPTAPPAAPAAAANAAAPDGASAQLQPASGSAVTGTVTFQGAGDGLRVVAEVQGLAPGKHGFHVHQVGDCSAPDAKSAGDHFDPHGAPHGGPDMEAHHGGDLGNIEAGADGRARLERTVAGLALAGPESILGRSVLVHAAEDDLKTQPSGNSGARIACGVIEAAA